MSKIDFLYKNYIFDLYGTLVDIHTDEENLTLWKKVGRKLKAPTEEVKSLYLSLCKNFSEKEGENKEFDLLQVFEKMVETYNSSISPTVLATFFRKISTEYENVFPKVKSWLKTLKKAGRGIYLISNAQSCFTYNELKRLKLLKYFNGIVISSEVGYKKPSLQIFDIAFRKFNIGKDNSVFVGNDLHDDILGAHNYGIKYIYVETKQSGHYPELEYLISNK